MSRHPLTIKVTALCAALLTAACHAGMKQPPAWPDIAGALSEPPAPLLEALRALRDCPTTLKAELSLSVENPRKKMSVKTLKAVMLARTPQLRLRGTGPLGVMVVDLAYRPDELSADLPHHKKFITAGPELTSWARENLGMKPDDFFDILCPKLDIERLRYSARRVDGDKPQSRIYLYEEHGRYLALKAVAHADAAGLALQDLAFLPGRDGKLLVSMEKFRRSGAWLLPHLIRLEHPASGYKGSIRVGRYEAPAPVPAEAFRLSAPPNREHKTLFSKDTPKP